MEQMSASADTGNPLTQLVSLLSDQEVLATMMDLGILLPRYQKLAAELTGVSLPPAGV